MFNRIWSLAHGRQITLGPTSVVMGIVNVTPDSFSDGGESLALDAATALAARLRAEGADIIDIGGESTRPGAEPVSALEEQRRVIPVIEALAGDSDVLLSIDTYREETARAAIDAGAHIVNDVTGLQGDPAMARLAAQRRCGVVAMHTGRGREKLPDVVADQYAYLGRSIEIAREAGIRDEALVLDPGFGFAKDADENIELIARFEELAELGFPLLAGTSRKRFLGAVTGRPVEHRRVATAASSAILRLRGACIFRVHDVRESVDALKLADAVLKRQKARTIS